jgi:hypothetical protein
LSTGVLRYVVPARLRAEVEELTKASNAELGPTYETWNGEFEFLVEVPEEHETVARFMFLENVTRCVD